MGKLLEIHTTRRPSLNGTSHEKMSGGHILMQSLVDNGVDTIFGYPGGAIMPTYDAIIDYPSIRHILVAHEQSAAHAADAWARIKRRACVALATSGPGATNLLTGIYTAHMDGVPMVAITGQVASNRIETDAFQEVDIVRMSRPVTKWSYQIQNPDEIQDVVQKAFEIANSGRPGPVLLDFPKDHQIAQINYSGPKVHEIKNPELTPFATSQLEQSARLLDQAKKPLILAGRGVLLAHAEEELYELSQKTGVPVANTLLGLSSYPEANPNYVGMVGMHGRLGANRLTQEADVLLVVGARGDDRVVSKYDEYAVNATIIHIDLEAEQLNRERGLKSDIAIHADAKTALTVLLEKTTSNTHPEWLSEFKKLDAQENEEVTKPLLNGSTHKDPTMREIVHTIAKKTEGRAIIATDVGQHQMVVAQEYPFMYPNSIISSGGAGTMGYGLPAGMGAQIAAPDRLVIVIAGDGGFQMTAPELTTVKEENLPLKIMVFNNSFLGMVRQWQDRFFDRRSQVSKRSPDFTRLALAHGIDAETVLLRKDVHSAMDRMLSAPGPYLLHFKTSEYEEVFPMVEPGTAVHNVKMR